MGWNLQAVLAYLVGIALPFAGFVGTLGPTVSAAASDMGHLGWMLRLVLMHPNNKLKASR